MRTTTTIAILCCALTGLAAATAGDPARAASANPAAARVEAMKKLDRWVGEWKGSGWSSTPTGARVEFDQVETVERRVGGTVLLVGGKSTTRGDGAGVAHDGIVLVSFDDKTGRYRWHGHDLARGVTDAEVTLTERGFQWCVPVGEGGAVVRFTIELDEKHWHEVGEVRMGAAAWSQFMTTDLERQ